MSETAESGGSDTFTVELSTTHAVLAAFVVGIFVGGFFMSAAGATGILGLPGGDTGTPSGDDNGDSRTPTEVFQDISDSIGADTDALSACISDSNGTEVQQDIQQVRDEVGQVGTPSFLIGTMADGFVQIEGAQPYSSMQPVIEDELAGMNGGQDRINISSAFIADEPTLGSSDAELIIIEISDFGCPWCAEWAGIDAIPQRAIDQEDSFNQIVSNYVETGDARFVYKDYPVQQLHPNAPQAHVAANCILDQDEDLYWEFHDELFAQRSAWMR